MIDMASSGKYERAGIVMRDFRHKLVAQRKRHKPFASDRHGQYRLAVPSTPVAANYQLVLLRLDLMIKKIIVANISAVIRKPALRIPELILTIP